MTGPSALPGELKPTPDPTILTTEQLLREVDRVKELSKAMIEGLEAVVMEKFRSVDVQFTLVERGRTEQKLDTKAAVDAALTAQKEAVREQTTASERAIAKSETSTTKQLEQLNATLSTAINGVTASLNDLKERIQRVENIKQGGQEKVTGIYALIAALVGIAVLAAWVNTRG